MKKFAGLPLAAGLALSVAGHAAGPVPPPYRVKPDTVDWQCAQNTSQFVQLDLKDAHLIDPNQVDDKKTEIQLLLKKSFGHGRNEYVYFMVLHPNKGKPIPLIAVGTTEEGECPSDNIKTYLVSRQFGKLPTLQWFYPIKGSQSH